MMLSQGGETSAQGEAGGIIAAREAFYGRIGRQNLAPLWTSLANLVTPEPRSGCAAAAWRFADIRAAMMEAGELITAREAERRVLVLENPGLRGMSKITTSLHAGVQMVLPGEVAPSHRHSQSALRFVLEGHGAHTTVDGERTVMQEGDFVITPPMAWHDHGNESDAPMFWLDGLDIPLVQFLDCSFAEHADAAEQSVTRPTGDSAARYGANLLPVDYRTGGGNSPVFNYPYARTRDALARMALHNAWDPCHGLKMCYINPANGGHAMNTLGTYIQLLPAGFATSAYRATDATIVVPIEGCGRSVITGRGGEDFVVDWGRRDIFVVPSWHYVRHEASEESVLFSFSDRPVQQALHLFREDRGNA